MKRSVSPFVLTFFAGALSFALSANALPSYARQTGLACNGCHTTAPELNNAGRLFKLLGYTDRAQNKSITADADKRRAPLNLLESLPLSAFLEVSETGTNKPQTGTQNWNYQFPQDIGLFLAGAWAAHLGSFVQVTYNVQDDHFTMDNTEIRFANKGTVSGKELVYGLTMNNNPTLEDLWNSTPAWGYPFVAANGAPGPAANTVINGSLAQDVAGFGGFAMLDQHYYVAGTLYRSDHVGDAQPTTGVCCGTNIQGVAPYYRVAYQRTGRTNMLEVGGYGIHLKSTPGGVTGAEDDFTDFGPDIEYDRTIGKDVLTFRGSFIRENENLAGAVAAGGANPGGHHLNQANANLAYHYGNRASGTVGWFNVHGTVDSKLYPQAPISGSANGDPRSAGWSANVSYWPIQNLDLALQYTGYTRFNGGSTNYDLAGRNASDNNTVYLVARYIF